MGQFETARYGGSIHLVETVEDVERLEIDNPEKLAFVTQTTLSMDDTAKVIAALQQRFPKIQGPKKNDICYATQNRQDAVKQLAEKSDLVLVVGSPNSSNSNRLKEIAVNCGSPAYLIDDADDIRQTWLNGVETIGVTAGASAPEALVEGVIVRLSEWGAPEVESLPGREEKVVFSLPKALQTT